MPDRLRTRGYVVAVPDLRPVLDGRPPFYERLFAKIAAAAGGANQVAVVAHSRGGPLLPGAMARIRTAGPQAVAHAVWLDARLPHDGQTWLDTAADPGKLLGMVHDGRVLPWHRWFEDDVAERLIPGEATRRRFRAETPALPAELLSEPMPPSPVDGDARHAYIQLSDAYAPAADLAAARGWAVTRYALTHLAPLTRSADVADAIATTVEIHDQ